MAVNSFNQLLGLVSKRPRRRTVCWLVCWLGLLAWSSAGGWDSPSIAHAAPRVLTTPLTTAAQTSVAAQSQSPPQARLLETQVGIAGHVRLGCWTEVRVRCQTPPPDAKLVIRAPDSDGNTVEYRWGLTQATLGPEGSLGSADSTSTYLGLFRLGRQNGTVAIAIETSAGETWAEVRLSGETNPELTIHAANDRLWLYLGPELELGRALGWSVSDKQAGAHRLISLSSTEPLPLSVWGWDGIERMVGCADGQTWPQNFSEDQLAAFQQWLVAGGRLSLALRDSWSSLFGSGGSLSRLLPDLVANSGSTTDSSQIELLVTSRTQLISDPKTQSLPFLWFDTNRERAVLMVESKPVLERRSCGVGQIDLLGFDPTHPLMAAWPSRGALLTKWLDYRRPEAPRLSTAYGYSDVTGRMRSALEQFSRVQVISFTAVALIILGFVALLIGDYFVLKRVIGNMQWAWLTLPIYCLLACLATWSLFRSAKPTEFQLNQAELIDIDATGGYAGLLSNHRPAGQGGVAATDVVPGATEGDTSGGSPTLVTGRLWASLYSPAAENLSLGIDRVDQLPLSLDESSLGWLGLPGAGLGGMQSENKLIGSAGTYEVAGQWELNPAAGRSLLQTQVAGMPFFFASSRVLTGGWSATLPPLRSTLRRQAGRDRLMGTLTNPLPVELTDCFVVYANWGYRLSRPLGPGDTIDLDIGKNQAKPESFEDWLRRPNANVDDLFRILEMLTYHEQSGGASQTRLLPGYQGRIDLSHLSRLDRAVLIGRHEGSFTRLKVQGSNDANPDAAMPRTVEQDRQATLFRIVLPVQAEEAAPND